MKEMILKNKKICIIVIAIVSVLLLFIIFKIISKPHYNFKNPKTITISGDKHNVDVTYDDNGDTKYIDGDIKKIENRKDNFKIKFEINNNTVSEQEKIKQNVLKNDNFIVKDLRIGGYKGYSVTDKKTAYTSLYLYVNERDNVVLESKISSVDMRKVEEKIKKGAKAEDIIYNLYEVQKILSTINYR